MLKWVHHQQQQTPLPKSNHNAAITKLVTNNNNNKNNNNGKQSRDEKRKCKQAPQPPSLDKVIEEDCENTNGCRRRIAGVMIEFVIYKNYCCLVVPDDY